MGKKTAANVTEIEITAKNISFRTFDSCLDRRHTFFNFLKMFSVTTIRRQLLIPVAKTMANSVKTLIEKPHKYIIKESSNQQSRNIN